MGNAKTPGTRWFDEQGMPPWVEGMSAALGRRVALVAEDGREMVVAGDGQGDSERFPLHVNGVDVAHLVVTPAVSNPIIAGRVQAALATLTALAEARFTAADLVQTTARQWRELSVLYRSSDLLRGGLDPRTVAEYLLTQATRALPRTQGAVVYRVGAISGEQASDGAPPELLILAQWGRSLEEGIVVVAPEELPALGYEGDGLPNSLIVVPLACRGIAYGALALASPSEKTPGAEDLKLAKLLAGQAGQAFANIELVENVREGERLRRELEVAADIQKSILPEQAITWEWLEFRGLCKPATWVGGDANLAMTAADGAVLSGVADVSGHGVSSALLMNAFSTQVNALAVTTDDPGRLLAVANDLVCERVGAMGMFVTAVLMHLHPNGRVRVANAGHPAPILVTADGETALVGDPGLPLGVLAGEVFEVEEIDMPPGSLIVAFSDGVTEAMNPDGDMYGVDRLVETLARHAPHCADGGDLIDRVLAELQTFERGEPRSDDLTIIVLRRTS
jgi:sigma-B regulation protein RsbU (phosphoserine phosphatase)